MSHKLLTTQDLSDRLGVSSTVLHEWRQEGRGPCFIQIGGMIRYSAYEVEQFERRFKSRSDWVVGQLAAEPKRCQDRAFGGRLRRTEFSQKRTETTITAYLDHLFNPDSTADPAEAITDYAELMTLKITARDLGEDGIKIDGGQLSAEILFVDLLNTLSKLAANMDTVLNHARSRLTTLDPLALQRAVDQFADMSTRTRIRQWVGRPND